MLMLAFGGGVVVALVRFDVKLNGKWYELNSIC